MQISSDGDFQRRRDAKLADQNRSPYTILRRTTVLTRKVMDREFVDHDTRMDLEFSTFEHREGRYYEFRHEGYIIRVHSFDLIFGSAHDLPSVYHQRKSGKPKSKKPKRNHGARRRAKR